MCAHLARAFASMTKNVRTYVRTPHIASNDKNAPPLMFTAFDHKAAGLSAVPIVLHNDFECEIVRTTGLGAVKTRPIIRLNPAEWILKNGCCSMLGKGLEG